MKQLALLLFIILFTSFKPSFRADEPAFKVEIAYRSLPDPKTTEYTIDNKKMILDHVIYDNKEGSFQSLNKSTFKDFDRARIIAFLRETNWSDIPAKMGTPNTEGQQYVVKIEIDNQAYNFEIGNTYNQTIANLLTICNEAIPDKDKRQKYFIPYK